MSEQHIWTELYDPKEGRKLREIPMQSKCQECEQLGGHRIDCSSATKEQLYRIAKTAEEAHRIGYRAGYTACQNVIKDALGVKK